MDQNDHNMNDDYTVESDGSDTTVVSQD